MNYLQTRDSNDTARVLAFSSRRVGSRMPNARFALLSALWLAIAGSSLRAQTSRATVREYQRVFPTYPFSDPNPIPVVGRIYPYFRFDGFAHRSEPHSWKVVELENDYLRVMILPEIGGKIWNAVDKRTNRSFIYFNQAVKFRDVAMRGPWTSGGIEANYGIIGHTPNVATPVDYLTRTNADGSVSCIIGALDLLTRTPWRLEIRLGRDEAMFSTASFWYNSSPLEQPYYTWMNVGIKVAGNLQFIYPGTSYLGHAGEHAPWPKNAQGRDISWYDNNDFGGYKSYHVFGRQTDFFGAYWHDDDLGMVRYAPRDEKLGKKIWIWGLSRQGMIWEQLLTDSDGQYAEVQSGRLFNQATELSTATPFKHRGFAPHVADRWTEYWYPVAGTKGIVAASRDGALNVVPNGDAITVTFSPTQQISDTLRVMSGSKTLYQAPVVRRPLELFSATIPLGGVPADSLRIVLGDDLLEYVATPGAGALARPLDSPATFDWSSTYGLQLQGKEWIRQREYAKAVVSLDSALAKDPHYVPALTDRAMLAIRSGEYESARQYAMTALSIDTYDPVANYYYGLANRRLGRLADARDGFEVAASAPEMRGAAWTELARMSLAAGRLSAARAYAEKALGTEPGNLDALGVEISVARRLGDGNERLRLLQRLETVDPLSHHARLERLLATGGETLGAEVLRGVRAELPEQVLLELATWYIDVGEMDIARRVLEGLGDNPEAMYWRASLPGTADAEKLIARANRVSPRFVLPFRAETMPALQAAARASTHWAPRYYLALTLLALGRHREADSLLLALGDEPDFAPFYAVRASVPGRSASDARHDLERAAALDGSEWRYGKLLVDRALQAGDTTHALAVARRSRARFASNDIVRLMFDRMLVAAGEFVEADRELQRLDILPQEGANEVHALYRQSKLVLAVDAISARKWKAAASLVSAAREWPERLGEGKPYDADVDERLEDWLDAAIMDGSGRHGEALQRWNRLAVNTRKTATASDVLPLWALERLGRGAEAAESLRDWSRDRLTRGADGRVLERWLARFGGSMQSPGTKGRR